MSQEFAKRLKDTRLCMGITSKEMAEKLQVSSTTYSNYEGGLREPNFRTLKKIASILQVSIDDLLANDDEHLTEISHETIEMNKKNLIVKDKEKVDIVYNCNIVNGKTTLNACKALCPKYYICQFVEMAKTNLNDYNNQ